jgi:hypothetical protein
VGSATGAGLSGAAATVLALLVVVSAGVVSAASGNGFGTAFNVVYLLVVLYLAFRTRVEDRFIAVIVPPVAYALALGVGSFFDSETPGSGVFLTIQNAFVPFFLNAPWLVGATVAAIVITLVRGRRDDVAQHRHRKS